MGLLNVYIQGLGRSLEFSMLQTLTSGLNGCVEYLNMRPGFSVMSYSADIAPILSANCTNGCHDYNGYGHPLLTRADVLLDTFIVVDNTSYLVNSLINPNPSKKMPLARAALSACQIAKIKKWVTDGAPQ